MDLLDDTPDPEPSRLADYLAPEALAPAGFVLALTCLLGSGLLSASILLAFSDELGEPSRGLRVGVQLAGAAIAAAPLLMGLAAVRRLLDDHPLWVAGLARATVLLAGVAVLARLLHALVAGVSDGNQFFGY
jgi:hypothetical protein